MEPVINSTENEPAMPETKKDEENSRLLEAMRALEAKNRELEEALKSRLRMRTIALALSVLLLVGLGLYF